MCHLKRFEMLCYRAAGIHFLGVATLFILLFFIRNSYTPIPETYQEFLRNQLANDELIANDSRLLSYLTTNYMIPPSNEIYNLSSGSAIAHLRKLLLKSKLSVLIQKTFIKYSNGFFFEAGALDGEFLSNTLWLEMKLNWTGILVEADPSNCNILKKRHRKAHISCTCVSPSNYAKELIVEKLENNNKMYKTIAYLHRANSRTIESKFHNFKDIFQALSTILYASVQCFPLSSYFLSLNVSTVDFMSLDTQGGEQNMLRNFNFDRIRVHYILVEHFRFSTPKSVHSYDDILVKEMAGKGFRLLHFLHESADYFFQNTKFHIFE